MTGIVQHMPCGVLVFDEETCLTLANERALEMLSPRGSDGATRPGDAFVPHPSDMLEDRLLGPCRALVGLALGGSVVGDRELQIQTRGPETECSSDRRRRYARLTARSGAPW